MDLEAYNRSFEEVIAIADEEAELKLREIRQQCVRSFITRITKRQSDWESSYRELLEKSQETGDEPKPLDSQKVRFNLAPTVAYIKPDATTSLGQFESSKESNDSLIDKTLTPQKPILQESKENKNENQQIGQPSQKSNDGPKTRQADEEPCFTDPYFSNVNLITEFIKIQQVLDNARKSTHEISSNPAIKSFSLDIRLFIRTRINTISNPDSQQRDEVIRLLTNLFNGQRFSSLGKMFDASIHPQGQLFAITTAAQLFVTIGTKHKIHSIAESMASVMTGLANNFPIFKDLMIGHLQECCPYLVPTNPKLSDFKQQKNPEIQYKVACGYALDSKTGALESEKSYLDRMKGLVLLYACFLVEIHIDSTWSWMAAFLSLKPKPAMTAFVLLAFLEGASKKMSIAFGRQYKKLIEFIRTDYLKMIEDITVPGVDRQSLTALKNMLDDDSKLFPPPPVNSIFGAVRI